MEKHSIVAEAATAAFVVSAQMVLKLGIGTVAVTGAVLLASGEIDILTFFMYLLVVSRMYDPLQ
ncbi:MAG: ABC transporter ATP-binding protein, partial [Treponema sp.]|nr:ABC transporter ATP-binding protein [Treponema sp.]